MAWWSAVVLVPSYAGFLPASAAASRAKRKNVREGGRAERLLRRTLWKRGLRYRVHVEGLPGRPDLVFPSARVAVFVDGDFWHGRYWPALRKRLELRANPGYWIPKISRNMERDQEQARTLEEMGWRVARFWETDVLKDVGAAADEVGALVCHPPAGSKPPP